MLVFSRGETGEDYTFQVSFTFQFRERCYLGVNSPTKSNKLSQGKQILRTFKTSETFSGKECCNRFMILNNL